MAEPQNNMGAWRLALNEYVWAHDALVGHIVGSGAASVMPPELHKKVDGCKEAAAKLKALSRTLLCEK